MKLENVRYYNIKITTIKEGRKEVPVGAEATLNVRFRLQQKKLATAGSETLVKPFSLSSTANAV